MHFGPLRGRAVLQFELHRLMPSLRSFGQGGRVQHLAGSCEAARGTRCVHCGRVHEQLRRNERELRVSDRGRLRHLPRMQRKRRVPGGRRWHYRHRVPVVCGQLCGRRLQCVRRLQGGAVRHHVRRLQLRDEHHRHRPIHRGRSPQEGLRWWRRRGLLQSRVERGLPRQLALRRQYELQDELQPRRRLSERLLLQGRGVHGLDSHRQRDDLHQQLPVRVADLFRRQMRRMWGECRLSAG